MRDRLLVTSGRHRSEMLSKARQMGFRLWRAARHRRASAWGWRRRGIWLWLRPAGDMRFTRMRAIGLVDQNDYIPA